MYHRYRNVVVPSTFKHQYKVTPMPHVRKELEDGGKIILPPSALGAMAHLNLEYPLLFEVTNPKNPRQRPTHCGVFEFTAVEGRVYMPYWMMQNIQLEPDEFVTICTRTLQPATFVKLQPQSTDFLDISNPKAVLEKELRKYAALTKNDIILLRYNAKDYYLQVLEIQPQNAYNAVSIIEADVNVDFAPPIGYEEKKPEPKEVVRTEEKLVVDPDEVDPSQHLETEEDEEEEKKNFIAFSGSGVRISGKPDDAKTVAALAKQSASPVEENKKPILTAKGHLVYKSDSDIEELRKKRQEEHQKLLQKEAEKKEKEKNEEANSFVAFSGKGYKLR